MAVFQGKPRCVQIAQIVAVAITLLFLIGIITELIVEWKWLDYEWYFGVGAIVGNIIVAVLLVLVILSGNRCLLLTTLIVIAILDLISLFFFNLVVLYFAVNNKDFSWFTEDGDTRNEEDKKAAVVATLLLLQFVVGIYALLEAIRYFCIYKVYKYASRPHVITTVRPQITVRTCGLP